jgi:hypothetical protein
MSESNEVAKTEPEVVSEPAPKRGPGRPKGSSKKSTPVIEPERKLRAVAEPTAEELQKQWWAAREREARAKQLGVSVEQLAPLPSQIEENWEQESQVHREPADPQYAGLYHLTGGAVCMNAAGNKYARPGTYVRLNAEDGKHVTERQIGVWVKP